MTTIDFYAILPLIILVAWASALLLLDLFFTRKIEGLTPILAALGLLITLVISALNPVAGSTAFNGMIEADGFSSYLQILFAGSGIVGIALAYGYLKRMGINRGEYYPLLLYSISGMILMAQAADLIVVFLALELLSIPLYILAGIARPNPASEEAALKYFLLGAFAGGFVVYGVALSFGATGTTSLSGIVAAVDSGLANMPLLLIGAGLILIGLGFKVALVPFHMWTPDVYHGAPTPLTAFMAVGAKAAGFAALLRIFLAALPVLAGNFVPVFWILSALTMFAGNLIAIVQDNIKRMLAYSSIAHAGYIMMAVVAFGQEFVSKDAVASSLFYLLAYAVTNFGAWSVVIALERAEGKGLQLEDYYGLGKKYPVLAAAMLVFMLSFIGVPPTIGFMGKFYLFRTVLEGGYTWLAVIGVLTSILSAYYYLRVVVNMYMREGDPEIAPDRLVQLVSIVGALAVVLLSVFATPLFRWASRAVLNIF
ncbi:MAG: NADH-quinone oxidoreductase subunit N [Anaerolineales bacterium]|nr:NADH-quinone oxidoreductase subunit N [Anaerolineales bacterium]